MHIYSPILWRGRKPYKPKRESTNRIPKPVGSSVKYSGCDRAEITVAIAFYFFASHVPFWGGSCASRPGEGITMYTICPTYCSHGGEYAAVSLVMHLR